MPFSFHVSPDKSHTTPVMLQDMLQSVALRPAHGVFHKNIHSSQHCRQSTEREMRGKWFGVTSILQEAAVHSVAPCLEPYRKGKKLWDIAEVRA